MNKEVLQNLTKSIFTFSGLQIFESQYSSLELFLQKKASEINTTIDDLCSNICKYVEIQADKKSLSSQNPFETAENPRLAECFDYISSAEKEEAEKNSHLLSEIINFITVNETYFFREEKQFDFLKNEIFPKYMGKPVNIWSAACSTGEEPLSIQALAMNCNLLATVYATDIDNVVLQKFLEGNYTSNSFRKDGSKYHDLLKPFFTKDEYLYHFNKDFIKKINIHQYNLTSGQNPFPNQNDKMDIIFIRNVFIYFDVETRKKVLNFLSSKLSDDGILLFSISEIASIDDYVIPDNLEKINYQDVYYFRHKPKNSQTLVTESQAKSRLSDKKSASATEKDATQAAKEYLQKIKENKKEKTEVTVGSFSVNSTNSDEKQGKNQQNTPENDEKNINSIKKIFADVCKCINKGDFETAKNHTLKIKASQKIFQFYMQAYISYHKDEKSESEKLFATAEMMSKDFWPAYFYHGLVLKDIGKQDKASFCFKKCCEILETNKTAKEFSFLMDSFNPSYIYSLCYKFQNE